MSISTAESGSSAVLITSFVPWLAHQTSNSSDDLIAALQDRGRLPAGSVWLRHVPVCFDLAPTLVIDELQRLRPRAVICCGMAENRTRLSIEKQAVEQRAAGAERTLQTSVDVQSLLKETTHSEVSYDAGRYVCNHLYYRVLAAIRGSSLNTVAIFVHVPVLNDQNMPAMLSDFLKVFSAL
ncbi:MAG: peptidase C15 [Phormidesmis sp.]